MTREELETEIEIFSLQFVALTQQLLMIKGHLKKEAKQELGYLEKHCNKLLTLLKFSGNNEEYMSIYTDAMNDQIHEVRKAIKQFKNK